MADTKITSLQPPQAGYPVVPATDVLPIVVIADPGMATSGSTRKVTVNQLLGAGGTATLASATITGDLTVDTSTLKVDSANDRVGIGTASPAAGYKLDVAGTVSISGGASNARRLQFNASGAYANWIEADGVAGANYLRFAAGNAEVMRIDSSGNVGIGVTPSAWNSSTKVLQVGSIGAVENFNNADFNIGNNFFRNSSNALIYSTTKFATAYLQSAANGTHVWYNAPSGTAGNAITFTQAMTLDASGNLLCGATTGTSHNLRKQGTTIEGDTHLNVGNTEHLFFACSSVTYNAAAAAYKVTRNSSTLRSINAGGTINASGADYAEYMVKCGDFTLSKGGIAGIDANGKLTNVFADAVSFVVKSTDPSYVGNDKWGVDLEGDALEAARQLVDRIAFAGQVPVNVTGAKAGDYIVPVVDGTGIKGIAVTSPTFEQYQIAVGKVIAIDADGRARIIVKVA